MSVAKPWSRKHNTCQHTGTIIYCSFLLLIRLFTKMRQIKIIRRINSDCLLCTGYNMELRDHLFFWLHFDNVL